MTTPFPASHLYGGVGSSGVPCTWSTVTGTCVFMICVAKRIARSYCSIPRKEGTKTE